LHFERPDERRFPCLRLAAQAFSAGGTASAMLNAANEVAVEAFLQRELRFDQIPHLIEDVLSTLTPSAADSIEIVLEADRQARELAYRLLAAGVA